MDLKPEGGGSHFGENVDLCAIPYGTFGARGGGGVIGPGYGPDTRAVYVYGQEILWSQVPLHDTPDMHT